LDLANGPEPSSREGFFELTAMDANIHPSVEQMEQDY
jgi:hypothetical protein